MVTIRPVRPQDTDLVEAMHTRLSATSVYNRYLRGYLPNQQEIRQMCRINTGFVATVEAPGEMVIGMAYYIILEDGMTAEPALLMEDQFQMQGIGSVLFQHLVEHAQTEGITMFSAVMSASNEGVMRMLAPSNWSAIYVAVPLRDTRYLY
jgi:GNAT superfamily N-acetyltransferase